MSTAAERPFNSFVLSPYAPKRARDRPARRQRPDRDGSTYAGTTDVEQIEASLRRLSRNAGTTAPGDASPLPRIVRSGPSDLDQSREREAQFIDGIRVPPSLAPARLRPPPPPLRERDDTMRGLLRILILSVIAAPIAYYFVAGRSAAPAGPALASLASRPIAAIAPAPETQAPETQAPETQTPEIQAPEPQQAPPPMPSAESLMPLQADSATVLTPGLTTDDVQSAGAPMRALDAEAINLLMRQGKQFVASGDLVSARLVYQRAAEAGNAAAALALGATFDPAVLARIGMQNVRADVDKARSWYEKAKEFGSADAPRRLAALAER